MLGLGTAMLLFAAAGAVLGAAVEARHRAQVGADTSALAGAMRAVEGEPAACDRAGELAEANGVAMIDCELSGLDVTVEVAAPVPEALAMFGPARGSARAGPAGPTEQADSD